MIGMSPSPLPRTHEEKTVQAPPDGAPLVEEWGGDVKGFLGTERSALSYSPSASGYPEMSKDARPVLLLMADG
jgi:hypothetical protein